MSDSTYDKNSRLLSASDFANLKIGSSSFKRASLIIYYKENSKGHARLGLSVSKKIGNSPIRNRFKRLLRENFRISNIRASQIDILIVVSFTRGLSDESQDSKEQIVLKHVNEFYQVLVNKK